MRSRFDEQLALLNRELIRMGTLCEDVIASAAKAMLDGDVALASSVAEHGSEIDKAERDIESMCLRLLLQQQPVARDLRQISAALKMITDMERIGDQAEDIADIVICLKGRKGGDLGYIGDMARDAIHMVTESVDAFVKQDVAMARDVLASDDAVDALFTKAKSSLIALVAERPDDGEYALDLLMIAKYLERIGDHATNIAEWVEFSVTGIHKGEAQL